MQRMKEIQGLPFMDVDDLRVGVFVHLDLGWMSHPFPKSSFRIASADQIVTLRGLGLKRVRWSPPDSDPELLPAAATPALRGEVPGGGAPVVPPAPASPLGQSPASAAASPAATRLREQLDAQKASLQACERQFAHATASCRQLCETVTKDPVKAAESARTLTQAFLQQMVGDQDLCIRLLTEAAGDKASAHAVNVALLSLLLGRSLGWGPVDMTEMGIGALLHDIGKIDVPERLRHSESHFSPSEQRVYEEHVSHGVARARKMGLSSIATLVIAQHHEMGDGTGFPIHLANERISMAARVVALVNRYDNLCNPHLLSRGLTPHEAIAQIYAQTQHKFDAVILAAFIKMMGVYPAGSMVQLNDGRFAMVVGVNSARPLRPRLLVHEPKVPRHEALIVDMERQPEISIRRSVKPLTLPSDAMVYLSPRQRVAYFFEPARALDAEAELVT
jgi:putative nucleotidyltransferase with HDIG domain